MHDYEFPALLNLLAELSLDVRIATLILLLIGAAIWDTHTHRIPNRLILCGGLFGVICTMVWPPAQQTTILFSLMGLVVALLLFFPLYLMRAMGAGDVKLLAMVGTFLGPIDTFYAAIASTIVGGMLSILWVVWHAKTMQLVRNLSTLIPFEVGMLGGFPMGRRIEDSTSVGKMPYGVAIAIGTISFLMFDQLGYL
jgi:prepilin peptidase CpaA